MPISLDGLTPDELLALADVAKQKAAADVVASAIARRPAVDKLGGPGFAVFAEWLEEPEPSSDYATAAAGVSESIRHYFIAPSNEKAVEILAALGLLYRRVMRATPHARNL